MNVWFVVIWFVLLNFVGYGNICMYVCKSLLPFQVSRLVYFFLVFQLRLLVLSMFSYCMLVFLHLAIACYSFLVFLKYCSPMSFVVFLFCSFLFLLHSILF